MATRKDCLRIWVVLLCASFAATLPLECEARGWRQFKVSHVHQGLPRAGSAHTLKPLEHFDAGSALTLKPLEHFDVDPSSTPDSYGYSSPFSLPSSLPPFCVYNPTPLTPPSIPQTPLTYPQPPPSPPIQSPTQFTPSPPVYALGPPQSSPSPPESSPAPNPPVDAPCTPIYGYTPGIPGNTPPSPPHSITGPPAPPEQYGPSPPVFSGLSPPVYAPGPPEYVPSPPQFAPSPPEYVPSPTQFVPSPPLFQPPVIFPPPSVPPPHNSGQGVTLWCVAKPSVPDPIIQEAMNYACGSGADCQSIQPEGPCFQPDTVLAHASFAFNSYWQGTKVAGGTCDFGGVAMLIIQDPSFDGCNFINN